MPLRGESLKQDVANVRGSGSALCWLSQEVNWNYIEDIFFF